MLESSLASVILDQTPTGVVVLDGDDRVSYANRSALAILGARSETLEHHLAKDLFGRDPAFAAALAETKEEAEEKRFSLTIRRADGGDIELGLTLTRIETSDGELATLLSFRDLMARRLLDQRSKQIQYVASIGRMAAEFAHSMLNPLASLSALVEVAVAESSSGHPVHETAPRMTVQIKRMEKLVRTCLQLEAAVPHRQRCEPKDLVQMTLDSLETRDRESAEVRLAMEPALPAVLVNSPQIAECLRLLLQNAAEAVGHASPVELRVARERRLGHGQFVRFEVRDEGPGIPSGDLHRTLQPFFTTKAQALGLGLFVAMSLAVRNGGFLDVCSLRGETVFGLCLPAEPGAET